MGSTIPAIVGNRKYESTYFYQPEKQTPLAMSMRKALLAVAMDVLQAYEETKDGLCELADNPVAATPGMDIFPPYSAMENHYMEQHMRQLEESQQDFESFYEDGKHR